MDEEVTTCCEDEEPVEGIPARKPPCTHDTCSFIWSALSETSGKLGGRVRVRGDNEVTLDVVCEPGDECGVLACFFDQDGKPLGLDVSLAGSPDVLEGVECTDADGNSLYQNPIRRIRNEDGSCSLGGLPIPITDSVCESTSGCDVSLGEGQEGDTRGACVDICATITNGGCYPMEVQPSVSIESARLGNSPITYRVTPKVNGENGDPIEVFSGGGGCCETQTAGGGETSSDGDPAHTHDGPSHTHTMASSNADNVYSGTVTPSPVTVQPGESLEYCICQDVLYEDDFDGQAKFNVGTIRVCLRGQSIVNSTTIAALEEGN